MRWLLAAGCAGFAALLCRGAAAQTEPTASEGSPAGWSPQAEERRSPHHARALLEMGAGLALGTGGYWLLMNRNVADWDNPRPLARFDGSAWVFDNNSIGVNFLGHPATGGLSYSFARANHHSVLGAFGYSFLTSFLWEFVIEFKEKVSANDVLVTPGAGLPLGEFFYKLGLYLDTGHQRSWGFDVARWTLGTGVALDRRLDGRPPPRVVARDALGFSSEIWHEFAARYGVVEVQTPSESRYARYQLGVAGRLVTLQGYGRPRAFGRAFWAAEISSFALHTEASRYGTGFFVAADTILAGHHAQRFSQGERGLQGESLTLGTSLGYQYLRSSANRFKSVENAVVLPEPELNYHAPNRREQYGALQLPGLALDFRVLRSGLALAGSARVQPSFAGLGAEAFYVWAASNLEERTKHILHRQGYFYGWGGAVNVATKLEVGPLRAAFELMYAAYRSQDGLDRHTEQLTLDVPAKGDVLLYGASLGIAPAPPLSVAFELGVRRFRSNVGGFELTARALQRGIRAEWVF
jgi:Domain of unknown function (DUF3943)